MKKYVEVNKAIMKINRANQGISVKKLNYIMSGITILISILLLITTYVTSTRYTRVENNTEDYIVWQRNAEQLQEGSDYLTEQVREFAATGSRVYLDKYFEESNVTKQRDTALEALRERLEGTESYSHLEAAMGYSVELMDREYYSMRLMIESLGYDPEEYPEEVRLVKLDDDDLALSKEEMAKKAELIVFDDTYHEYKANIKEEIHLCIYGLAEYTEDSIKEEFDSLSRLLLIQQILIIGLVLVIVVVIVLTSLSVIRPLIRAIPHIKEEKPLPLDGAYEYKYLAKTYNRMYEANKKQKRMLNYEATHDALTGVYNRMGYERIVSSIELSGLAALMIDIDNFKGINDTKGHEAGDNALVNVIGEVKKNFRTSDVICRIGGDEFVLFMSGVEATDDTKNLIREKVTEINSNLRKLDHDSPISISVGAAFRDDEADAELLVKKADTALYNVKEHGKRGCKFYDEIMDVAD